MPRRIAAFLLVFALFFALSSAALAENGEELLDNGDFSEWAEGASLPLGWAFTAYDESASAAWTETDENGKTYVVLENVTGNDARCCRTASVKPNTVYLLSGEILTQDVSFGTGANLSIDNYALDGTYCYSENLFGTDTWRAVTLYFLTGESQTEVNVALRLGGYGTTAVGTALYRNISLSECVSAPAEARVVDLASGETGVVSSESGSYEQTIEEEQTNELRPIVWATVLSLVCAALYAFFYMRYLRFEGALLPRTNRASFALSLILVAAFVLRVLLSALLHGHPTDLGCFMAWGNAVLTGGMRTFYTSGMFADYPPGYMYICGALAWLCRALNLSYNSGGMALLFKMPATIADVCSVYLLYRLAKRNGMAENGALLLGATLAFSPVLMFVSGAWGQIDTLLTLLLLLTMFLLQADKRILAGAIYGLAILMKPQALMAGPLLAVAYIADVCAAERKWKRLLETVLAVLSALGVLFVLSLPFKGTQGWDWLVEKYFSTASSYPYASIEAFNLPSLLGGNWKDVDMRVLGVPYRVLGTTFIALSVALSGFLYAKGFRKSRGALFLCGAVMITCVFTFGHYMHERYVLPALIFLLFAYAYYRDRRLLVAFGFGSMSALLNVSTAMFIVTRQSARGTLYNAVTAFGSALCVLSAVYLIYTAVSIILKGRILPPLSADHAHHHDGEPPESGKKERLAILPAPQTEQKPFFTRRDTIYAVCVTLIYAVVALTNLGSTKAPQTFWESNTAGESMVVRFDKQTHVSSYTAFGNIAQSGSLLIEGGGESLIFEQTYDDMFRWKRTDTSFTASEVTLTLYAGALKLNELAFFDDDGNVIPAHVESPVGSQACLFDEQDTVAYVPSYLNGMYFDELYHGRTAYEHLHNLAPYENSHPPLGKLFIMLGVAIFGMTAFGWRVVGALFGVGMLPIVYLFAKRITKRSDYALVAAALFAFDFMHFTQTRIATIDVYAVFFILLMYYFMYRYITMNFFADDFKKTLRPLALSGVFFGVGAACKWTCLYAGAGLAVLFFGSLIARYFELVRVNAAGSAEEKERVKPFWRYTVKTLLWCCLFFVAIPFCIYFASYTPYFIYEAGESANYGVSDMLRTFADYQSFMYRYHSGLNATHPYQSMWYSWPFTVKPMWYYYNYYLGGEQISTMSASGNPAVWWVSAIGAIVLLVLRLTKRIKPDRALQILCVGVCANFLPWVLVTRCTFIYHFFATVPFILLASVYLLSKAEERYEGIGYVKWAWVALAILFFILLYPGISGLAVSPAWAAFISKLPGGKLMYGA